MNLGISLETGSASPNSTELGSAASTQTGNAGQAGAVFGQLMAKAMQHHGHGQAQEQASPGGQNEANTALASDASQPCCEPTESGQGQGDTAALAPGHSDDALAQFNALWMSGASHTLTLPATPGVKSVSVGPSIQVITASSPAPDASSLTAFAHQQGLDAQAIAWLMNPHAQTATQTAAQAATPGADSGTLTGAVPGAMPAPGTGALFPPGMLAPAQAAKVPDAADSQLNTGALLGSAADPAANPVQTATALPGTHTTNNVAATATALAAAVPVVQAILSGPDSRKPLPTQAASTNTPPELTELSALTMAQLRWGGIKPRGLGQTDTAPSAPATSTATPTLWAQSDLDLSGLDLGLLAQDGNTPGQDSTAPTERAAGETPAIASAILGNPGRTEAQVAQARNPATSGQTAAGTPSDQMQQLSEKMADAVGERIMREIERGQWNLRLMLKPAHLGHIEVEMRLRAGQLDASFVAPQAATRELLQDGLDRLRQQLDQAGMDVANLHVKDGQTRQNGGDSTPGQRQFANNAKTPEIPEAPTPSVQSPPRPRRADGWDVTV